MTTFSADDRVPDDLDAALTEIRHLRRAMASRSVIDQAKGILMARHGCSADEAFQLLADASQRSNRPLRHLARSITGQEGAADRSLTGCDPTDLEAGDDGPVDVGSLLAGAVSRDRLAERRDRDAEARDRAAVDRVKGGDEMDGDAVADRAQAAVDRVHAGADRDASAADRAALLRLREQRDDPAQPGQD